MLKNLFKFDFNNYWRNVDMNILFGFFILFFLGLFFSFSSTSSLAGERLNKAYYFFFSKHLIFTILALLIMFVISAIDTLLLKKITVPLFIISFLLLILVPIIGVEVKGAKRWLDLYLFRLQPIELLKPFFILATVKILTLDKLKNSIIRVFKDLKSLKRVNNTILLSPGAASFDQFKNFENRGNEFKKLSILYAKKFI